MIPSINLAEAVDYISKFDKEEPKTIWKVGAIDTQVLATLTTKTGAEPARSLEYMIDIVRFGLKNFVNFKDPYGQDIKPDFVSYSLNGKNYMILADSIVKLIPMSVITELGGEILRLSNISEEQRKN